MKQSPSNAADTSLSGVPPPLPSRRPSAGAPGQSSTLMPPAGPVVYPPPSTDNEPVSLSCCHVERKCDWSKLCQVTIRAAD